MVGPLPGIALHRKVAKLAVCFPRKVAISERESILATLGKPPFPEGTRRVLHGLNPELILGSTKAPQGVTFGLSLFLDLLRLDGAVR